MAPRKHAEREPKPFPQYDDAAHIDSAAVAAVPPWDQDMAVSYTHLTLPTILLV